MRNSKRTNLTETMVNTPVYYINNFPVVTVNDTLDPLLFRTGAKDPLLVGTGANVLVSSLSEVLKVGRESTTLNFLIKNTASEFVGQTVQVIFDPDTEQYKVNGKVIVNVAGSVAIDALVAVTTDALVKAVLTALGAGAGIAAVTAVGVGLASFTIWTALFADTSGVEAIANFIDDVIIPIRIDDVIIPIRGPVPVDIQIIDSNGSVLGGALFEEEVDQSAEFEAIKKLLGRTSSTSFPDISIGRDSIKVVEKTIFFPQERNYKVYDGRFVDAIAQELRIAKEDLLRLGQGNSPNKNAQIYYESTNFNPKSFVFASDENRFFVPLPNTTGEISPVGLNPGNIISGSSGNDTPDVFKTRNASLLFTEQNVLLLGLEGDDIINGNIEDDIIVGGEGNDTINGGVGEDIVIFSDLFENYDYSISEDGTITFSHTRGARKDGIDKLKNIEFARFFDKTVALPLVALPLDGETPLNSEKPKGDVTFRFEATVAERKYVNWNRTLLPGGTAIPFVLEYSFDPKIPDRNPRMDGDYSPIDGVLTIGNQSTSIQNGTIHVDNDNDSIYAVLFSRNNGGSLFGLDLNSLEVTVSSSDSDLYDDSLPTNKIPTSAYFAQRADNYGISIDFEKGLLGIDRDYRSMSFRSISPSFTLESNGENPYIPIPTPTPAPIPNPINPLGFSADPISGVGNLKAETVYNGTTEDDVIVGTAKREALFGFGKKDLLRGGGGDDRLFGGRGSDQLFGVEGNDQLRGGKGNDYLNGGVGDDLLIGGKGKNTLVGGSGRDRFQIGNGQDTILDFVPGIDSLETIPGLNLSDLVSTPGVGATIISTIPNASNPNFQAIAALVGVSPTMVSQLGIASLAFPIN